MHAKVVPVLLITACLVACSKAPPAAPPAAAAVEVSAITVKARDVPVEFQFVGQTESSQQVEIRARVPGFLNKRIYTEGSMVKAGQPMFLIDAKPFNADLSAARAEMAQQQARLNTARANLTRVKPLVTDNALSAKDLDDATGQEQAAAAALEAARAKVTSAELNLSYATISSPVSGLSSFAKVQEGAYVDMGNSLLTYVAKLDPMRVNFSLSENESLSLRSEVASGRLKAAPGERYTVEVVLANGASYKSPGRITFADASFSQETGSFLVRAEIPNPKGELRPGQFVRVRVHGATRTHSIVIPQAAVQQSPRGSFVWVVDKDGKAAQRNVEAGQWMGDNWLVSSGLADGDRVVVDSILRMAPGVPLKPTEAPAVVLPPASSGSADAQKAGAATASAGAAGAAGATSADAASLLFASASTQLDAVARAELSRVAERLRANPQQRVLISGYVDEHGDPDRNAKLAQARASSVRAALTAQGIAATRIELKAPADIVGGADAEQARRVDIVTVAGS